MVCDLELIIVTPRHIKVIPVHSRSLAWAASNTPIGIGIWYRINRTVASLVLIHGKKKRTQLNQYHNQNSMEHNRRSIEHNWQSIEPIEHNQLSVEPIEHNQLSVEPIENQSNTIKYYPGISHSIEIRLRSTIEPPSITFDWFECNFCSNLFNWHRLGGDWSYPWLMKVTLIDGLCWISDNDVWYLSIMFDASLDI